MYGWQGKILRIDLSNRTSSVVTPAPKLYHSWIGGKGLAIARELVKTRRELAAKYDRPARTVVRDHLIIEIARHRWTKASEIKSLRGLSLRTQGIRALAEAAQRASKLPKEQWPTTAPPDDETDQEAAVTLLVSAVIRAHCAEHQIAHQLIGAKRDLRAFVRAHLRGRSPETPLALEQGWRAETIGAVVRAIVGGRAAVALRTNGQGLIVVAR